MHHLSHFDELVLAVLMALILFNVYASWRLVKYQDYSKTQKFWQMLIVWVVPVFGGILVRSVMREPVVGERDTAFTPDGGGNPPGIGMM